MGIIRFYFFYQRDELGFGNDNEPLALAITGAALSLSSVISDVLILLSIYYLTDNFLNSSMSFKKWCQYVIPVGLIVSLFILVNINLQLNQLQYTIEILLSVCSVTLLGIVIFHEFRNHGLHRLGFLTLFVFLGSVAIQFHPLLSDSGIPIPDIVLRSLSLMTQFFFYSIFVALTYTWVHEKTQKLIPLNFAKKIAKTTQIELLGNRDREFYKGLSRELKQLISENEIKQVLAKLMDFFKEEKLIEGLNMVIVQSSELYELNAKVVLGTITSEDYKVSRARIVTNLLTIIDEKLEMSEH
jgi:hypothetical protein